MAEHTDTMQHQNCEELQEEVVETSYVCGECFHVCTTMEDFSEHCCSTPVAEGGLISQDENQYQSHIIHQSNVTDGTQTETEADMEVAVASILVEKMKQNAPQNKTVPEVHLEEKQFEACQEHYLEPSIEHTSIVDYPTEGDPVLHIVEHTDQLEPGMVIESMEIPSTNVYIYDNPFYLNRLMKDNTCGRRARHDAPYTHRLGPWDDRSSRLLIQLLKEYPKAFFIMGKNSKRTEAWEMIRYKLSEAGYQFTVLQIRMRWRELCKRYRNVVNHNDLNKHKTKRTCQFFDELNDLFGIWDSTATELLIKELGANGTKRLGQNGGTRMRHKAWQQISDVLAENGYEFTADQVHGRWNALVMLYRRMVNHNVKPDNEQITIAFKESVESVFNYVPDSKISEKCEKHITDKKKWTLSVEESLLAAYKNLVDCFSKDQLKNKLWEQIAVHLKEDANYITTVEKVKTRFYELTKQYAAMLQHNSEPGTLYRESRHHETLAEIYKKYNCWPHDGSVIKLDKSNAIRLRQLDAQLLWTEEESSAVLQLYPSVLLEHIRNNDQPQPPEELWVQLAKSLYAVYGYVKAPYEIEEHIALLRRGHKNSNLFPFREAMDILEETENSLCFSPESPSRDNEQLLPYWSHKAARLMLDLVIHYRQEGIKIMTDNLFEVICSDMDKNGYKYTVEECREYYFLLQKIFKNRMYSKKKLTENIKPFPYMDRMTELRMIASQTGNKVDDEKCSSVLSAVASQLTVVKKGDKNSRRRSLEIMLLNCKMYIRDVLHIRPPPSIKELAGLLMATVKDETTQCNIEADLVKKLKDVLRPHMDVLLLISEHGAIHIYHDYQAEALKNRDRIFDKRNIRAIGVQWTSDNSRIMLETVREWQLLCHNNQEMEDVLGCGQPLWEEVAYKLSRRFNKCPQICWQYFIQLKKEYMAAVSSSGSLNHMPSLKTLQCQELLQDILNLPVYHDGEWDDRDARWISETKGWSCEESLELLFTVREFWPSDGPVNWKKISLLMYAGGFQRDAKSCYSRFKELYCGYQNTFKCNQESSIRDRQKSPFYYKIHSLYGYTEEIPLYNDDSVCELLDPDLDEEELIEVLLAGMKEIKNLYCHSVPRLPVLHALAQYAEFHSQGNWPTLNIYQIWKYLVQVHQAQRETVQQQAEAPLGVDLDGLWQDHPNPSVAFGLLCVPWPNWEMVSDWSLEELRILVETIVRWEGTSSSTQVDGYMAEESAQYLQNQGYDKTPAQCKEQWQYIVTTFAHGGYQNFKNQMNLVHLFQPSLMLPVDSINDHKRGEKMCPMVQENLSNTTHDVNIIGGCSNNTENLENSSRLGYESLELQRTGEEKYPSGAEYENRDDTNENSLHKESRLKAKVISVNEMPDSKIVVCEFQEGGAKKVLKIHYPLSQNIPNNIKYLHIPFHIMFPQQESKAKLESDSCKKDSVAMGSCSTKSEDNIRLESQINSENSARLNLPLEVNETSAVGGSQKFLMQNNNKMSVETESNRATGLKNLEFEEKETIQKKFKKSRLQLCVDSEKHNSKVSACNSVQCSSSSHKNSEEKNGKVVEKRKDPETLDVIQLSVEYNQQCSREDDRLTYLMKESQEELVMDYKKVLSVVQELSDLL